MVAFVNDPTGLCAVRRTTDHLVRVQHSPLWLRQERSHKQAAKAACASRSGKGMHRAKCQSPVLSLPLSLRGKPIRQRYAYVRNVRALCSAYLSLRGFGGLLTLQFDFLHSLIIRAGL